VHIVVRMFQRDSSRSLARPKPHTPDSSARTISNYWALKHNSFLPFLLCLDTSLRFLSIYTDRTRDARLRTAKPFANDGVSHLMTADGHCRLHVDLRSLAVITSSEPLAVAVTSPVVRTLTPNALRLRQRKLKYLPSNGEMSCCVTRVRCRAISNGERHPRPGIGRSSVRQLACFALNPVGSRHASAS
jgi:hypothetical protein